MANPLSFDPKVGPGVSPVQTNPPAKADKSQAAQPAAASFQDVLAARVDTATGLRFSSHALARLRARGIQIGEAQMQKIQSAVSKAASKGAREALLVTDQLAMIVSVKNRTVITALDAKSMKDNVFTNIDSAVIV